MEVSLTDLIRQANTGDDGALKRVFDAAYSDLRRVARTRLYSGGGVRCSTRLRWCTTPICASRTPAA